jgi:hypothetical protein
MSVTSRKWTHVVLPAVLILGTGLLWASPSPAAAQASQTIATTDGRILVYAADDGRMAWITFHRASKCYGVVHERVIRTGADVVLGRPGFGSQCAYDNVNIALAGSRALWSWFRWPCDCMSSYGRVVTAAPGQPNRIVEDLAGFDFNTIGDWVTGMAGDGQTLAYGRITIEDLDFDLGSVMITGGHVQRVTAARNRVVPSAGHPSALSVNGTRIAVVNASDAGGSVGPLENGPVYVREAVTGNTIATIEPTGFPRAIALGTQQAALMVEKADGMRQLEIYDAQSGVLVSSLALSADVDWRIDLDQGRVVYHRGRAIKLFAGGQSHVLAFAAAPPIGLSIEGRRVTWAENLNGRGRIRSVLVSTQN